MSNSVEVYDDYGTWTLEISRATTVDDVINRVIQRSRSHRVNPSLGATTVFGRDYDFIAFPSIIGQRPLPSHEAVSLATLQRIDPAAPAWPTVNRDMKGGRGPWRTLYFHELQPLIDAERKQSEWRRRKGNTIFAIQSIIGLFSLFLLISGIYFLRRSEVENLSSPLYNAMGGYRGCLVATAVGGVVVGLPALYFTYGFLRFWTGRTIG